MQRQYLLKMLPTIMVATEIVAAVVVVVQAATAVAALIQKQSHWILTMKKSLEF